METFSPRGQFTTKVASVAIALLASGCSGGGSTGTIGGGPDGAGTDADTGIGIQFETGETGACGFGCPTNQYCYNGACIEQQPPCKTDDDCQNDTYCDATTHTCIPYGPPGKTSNPDCVSVVPVGIFAPAVLCEFIAAPATDPPEYAAFLNVLATPTVATFEVGGMPSVVVPFYDGTDGSSEQDGILRVLNGNDCTESAMLGKLEGEEIRVSASSAVAIGDLDGDKIPDVVAYYKPNAVPGVAGGLSAGGSVIAFTKKAGVWTVLWKAHNADGSPWSIAGAHEWAGPSIHDLDDDGFPEVLREGYVFDHTGKLIAGEPPGFSEGYGVGQFPVVADIDGDGAVEMVNGAAIYRFDATAKAWTTVVAAIPSGFAGLTALADFGTNAVDGVFDGKAEIAVVVSGHVIVESPTGAVVWGPITLPGSAGGGPPTIADFDGDGQPEIAVAGSDSYSVIDPDCQGTSLRPGGKCATARTDGILWSVKSQDHSSNITGSSVFDFDADGIAEAIYGDECFARVYEGNTGEVIFSQYLSSCTWYENPIVADTNNDDRAELVTGSNLNCGVTCGAGEVEYPDPARPSIAVDAVFKGLKCKANGDCASGLCDTGYCRCTADAQCCALADDAKCQEFGYVCMPQPAGVTGTGNVCRAAHPHGRAGVRIYHDIADRWVQSRAIWNQHAYSITNVNDDGTIPKTSAWTPNWKATSPRLNDFRKNSPGNANPKASPDLTAKGSGDTCVAGTLTLSVQVCNRGAAKAADNYTVTFHQLVPASSLEAGVVDAAFDAVSEAGVSEVVGPTICVATTSKPLDVGECQAVSCVWTNPPRTGGVDVTGIIDETGHVRQCNKDNKTTIIRDVSCAGPS
ncbi:MAG: hypothetical protein ACHREM_14880 [Polyangiales bacterium]